MQISVSNVNRTFGGGGVKFSGFSGFWFLRIYISSTNAYANIPANICTNICIQVRKVLFRALLNRSGASSLLDSMAVPVSSTRF